MYTRMGADKREDWQDAACTGKRRHLTIEEAELSKRALELQGDQGLNVYWCLWCFAYHVGHAKGKRAC
jgi:hypothetical protein